MARKKRVRKRKTWKGKSYSRKYPVSELRDKTWYGRPPIEVHDKRGYSYLRKDKGARGKADKTVQRSMGDGIEKGKLADLGYSTKKSARSRHIALGKAVRKYGYPSVRGMLGVQAFVFRKGGKGRRRGRGGKKTADVFKRDFDWLVDKYGKGGKRK